MKGFLPFLRRYLSPRSLLLSIFLVLISVVTVQAKTVVVGAGFGFISVPNMAGLNPGDVIAITPGTYSGAKFEKLNGITITNNGGAVIFNGQVTFNSLQSCTFDGFQFKNCPGIAIRWDGNSRRCVEKNIYFYNVQSDCNNASEHNNYNGDTSTLKLYMCTFDSLTAYRSGLIMMGSWGTASSGICFMDSIVFSRVKVDSTTTNGTEVRGTFFRLNAHDWRVIYKGVNTILGDVGIFYISGSGSFHHIYRNGGRGYIVRLWNIFLKNQGNSYFYDNVDLNSTVYGSIDVRIEPQFFTQYLTGGNVFIYNNTAGNKGDNINYWSSLAVVGQYDPPYVCHVKNNLGFNITTHGHTTIMMNQGNAWTGDTTNNMYFNVPDGVVDPVTGTPVANSPVLGKGMTIPWITDDLYHNPRSGAYDIGAVQHGGAIIPPPPNQLPVAIAGAAQTITLPVNNSTLDGSKSYDPDGSISKYAWTLVSGTGGTITNPANASTTVTGLTQGTYIYKLTITDNSNGTATALDTIIVKAAANLPPIANAGADQTITLPVSSVTVNGSASKDQDNGGLISSYAWSQSSGPSAATIANPGQVSTTISGLQVGVYVFKLIVTDAGGATSADSLSVTVKTATNIPPVANAGISKSITLPLNTTSLDGSLSSDADGTISAYSWAQVSGPSTATLTNAGTAIATAANLVAGVYNFELTVTDNSGASSKAQVKVTVVAASLLPPIANAGANLTITLPTNKVNMDGSGSVAPSGSITSYAWTQASGPSTATLATPNSAQASASNLVAGTYIFRLTIKDNNNATATDSLIVLVNPAANIPPVANAGASITITLPVNTATLNGTASSDADGTITAYSWAKVSGPATATLTNANGATATASNLVAGVYNFELTVTDNSGASSKAQVKVTVVAASVLPPIANAGANLTITLPVNNVIMDGSGSVAPSGNIVSYAWTQASGPSTATLGTPNAAQASAINLVAGTYIFRLTVKDNNNATATDSLIVLVNPAINIPPAANAGASITITLPVNTATLNGSASSDADGTITAYSWAKVSGPATATITIANAATTTVSNLVAGVYNFELTVTDNSGANSKAQVKVTVVAASVLPPIANAGANLTITLPTNQVSMDGSSSVAPSGNIVSYTWTEKSGPSTATLGTPNSAQASAGNLVAGTYIFLLTVKDNNNATATDSLIVLVNPAVNIPPVAKAGTSLTVTLPLNSTSLNGSASSDADGTITAYNWTQVSGPSTATLTNAGTAIATAANLVAGNYTFELTVTDNSGASSKAQVKITVVAAGLQPPIANAGANLTITLPTNQVSMDGSGSVAPSGNIVSYAWTQTSGPTSATLGTPNAAQASASNLVTGTYIFRLTIKDNNNATATDSLIVLVKPAANIPPVANAGASITITLPTNTATLKGSASSDADGTITAYNWTQLSGPNTAGSTGAGTASISLTGLIAGQYVYQLQVTDNSGAKAVAQVKVTVVAASLQPPIANAGANLTITLPTNQVSMDGSGSVAPAGNIVSYTWTQTSGPTTATLGTPNSAQTYAGNLVVGTYIFRLTIKDNNNATATDSLIVLVNPAVNIPPVADAGSSITITLPTNTATLNGGASSDADGTISAYSWTQVSGPNTAGSTGAGTASISLTGLIAGQYVYQLQVTDNSGAKAVSQVKVTVVAASVQTPIANAGANLTITLPTNKVNMDGSGSVAPSGNITSYTWTQASGPSTATLATPNAAQASASNLVAGTYIFRLTIKDNNNATATDSLIVLVNPAANIPPVANAGASITITLPVNTATLNGTASSDADGTITAYSWTQVSGPNTAGSTGAGTATISLTGLIAGQYVYQLQVSDNSGATAIAQARVTVVAAGLEQPPIANAGANLTISLPTNQVSMDGSGSVAPSGNIVSYTWTQASGPTSATLGTPNAAQAGASNLVAGTYIFRLTIKDNNNATATDSLIVLVNPAANIPPVANAGASITITLPTNTATLNGGASSDADGTISAYSWTQVSGPNTAGSTGAGTASISLTGLIAGQYVYQLQVTDNSGATAIAQTKVTVVAASNVLPIANAGADQTITAPASTVNLDGSASNDPDGTIKSYTWVLISGNGSVTISNGNTASPSASGLTPGIYVFQLTVTDNSGATAKDQVTITVNPEPAQPNQAPVANAGNNLTITAPVNSVGLNGSSSFDLDGTITSYSWNQVSGPSTAVILNNGTATPTVTGLVVGTYKFALTVTDNDGATSTDAITVTVNAAINKVNQMPIALAGNDTTIYLPVNSYTLDAAGSFDPDGNISSYQWQEISGPNTVTPAATSGPQADASNLLEGVYEFQVTVTDNEGATATAIVRVTVDKGSGYNDQLILFPNPAHDVTTARVTSSANGAIRVSVYDMNGRIVLTEQTEKSLPVFEKTLNVSPLASGMYTLQVIIGNHKTIVTKFIKQ